MGALYDADVDDDEIIRVLNKYWGINRDEAEKGLYMKKVKLQSESRADFEDAGLLCHKD